MKERYYKIHISNLPVILTILVFVLTGMYRYTENTFFVELKNNLRTFGLPICMILMYFPRFRKIKVCNTVLVGVLFGITMVITLALTGELKLALVTEVLLWPALLLFEYRNTYLTRRNEWSESVIKNGGMLILLFCFMLILNSNHEFRFYTQSLYHAYYAITFYPFVLNLEETNRNKKFKAIFGVLIGILIVLSNKRGGIIAFGLAVLSYYTVKTYTDYGLTKRVKRLCVLLLVVIVGISYFQHLSATSSSELIRRLNDLSIETGSSGRNYIWEAIIQAFLKEDLIHKLFGAGFNGTYSVTANVAALSTLAHNDFIGVLYDYGIVSVIALATFCITIIVTTARLILQKNRYAATFAYSVAVVTVLSMVSTCLSSSEIIMFFALFWGQALASIQIEKEEVMQQYE